MRKGVVIVGYYGANNTGDEAILTGMIHALKAQGITDITVLSRDPEQTRKIHGVNSIYIGRRFDGLIEIFHKMRKSKLFILGGGGLLQDYSRRVVPYWLSRVLLALLARTPVMYYAQGIGPLRTKEAKRLVRLISNRVKWITVRDEESLSLLQELGVFKPRMEVTADPALGIKVTSNGLDLLRQAGIILDPRKIKVGISLRSWKGEESYLPVLIQALQRLKEEYDVQYIFFPFQFGEDEGISQKVMEAVEAEDACLLKGTYTPEQVAAMLKEMDGVIAMRLHAVILSAVSFVPSFGLIYDPKVLRFMERAGIAAYSVSLERMQEKEEAFNKQLVDWLAARQQISEQMEPRVEAMMRLSLRSAEIAKQLMNDFQ
ncbi:MAG: polysaccharide pyruvyl transferase CsaB [Peptococcaceae bacterium]|nr:polysaccharide pyruvyl transferase CsaB [Peptococcaceae bacterium]